MYIFYPIFLYFIYIIYFIFYYFYLSLSNEAKVNNLNIFKYPLLYIKLHNIIILIIFFSFINNYILLINTEIIINLGLFLENNKRILHKIILLFYLIFLTLL